MIIGNNNKPTFNSNFNERFQTVKNKNIKPQEINQIQNKNQYTNVTNKNEMADKSFAMLQERFNNGLISLEEFKQKCNQLNKLRQK